MKPKNIALTFMLLLIAGGMALVAPIFRESAQAQEATEKATQYGELIPVASLKSYGSSLAEWKAPNPGLRDIATNNVFPYEVTGNQHTDRAAFLAKLNELAESGWRLFDADARIVVREK